jgi:subtilase family serine protease
MERWGFRAGARGSRLAVRALIVSVLIAAVAVLAISAEAGTPRPQSASVQRAAAAPLGAAALGAPASSAGQTGYVVLKPRDEQALQSFITSVNKPHSSLYHRYLRAGQFDNRFGPSGATVDAVRAQLYTDGLKVTSVARDGLLIGFSGTTSNVETAFGTKLERYRSAAGITGEQTTKAVSLPSNIASDVTAVIGLNTLVHPEADLVHAPESAYAGHKAAKTGSVTHYTGAPNPCSDAANAASEFGGLTDDQIANAYGATSLYAAGDTGAGVSIGVYELEPYSPSDLASFDQCYFGSGSTPGGISLTNVDGGQPSGYGSGESILDIEDVSAMAPGAHIDVYEAPNTGAGSLDEYAQMVNDDADQIITSSWGLCEQDLQQADPGAQQAENYIFEQAAAQGQTVLSAAGDTGDDTCNEVRDVPPPNDQNPLSVDDPSSQPYVIGVGGTTLEDADPSNYDETVWNDGAEWGGGGGGLSESWEAPSWQQSLAYFSDGDYGTDLAAANAVEDQASSQGISSQNLTPGFCANNTTAGFTASTPCRGVPDVSAQADEFTGAVTIFSASFESNGDPSSGWITIGGTSSATPIWAAMLALVDSSSACTSTVELATSPSDSMLEAKPDIGFASPLLYAVAENSTEYAESFHDITVGNNDVYGFDNGAAFPARTGYDLASGLGSPELTGAGGSPGLADNLCDLASNTTTKPTVTGLNPTVGTHAGGNQVIVTGSGFESGTGTVEVQSVTIGSDVITLPSAAVTVNSASQMTITMPTGSTSLAPGADGIRDLNTGITYNTGGSYTDQDGAGLANIVVTLTNGDSSPTYADSQSFQDQYTYVDQTSGNTTPSVSSISPYAGAQAGGNTITVYGSGFASNDTVTVGGVTAPTVTYVSPWELKVVTPEYDSTNTSCTTQTELLTELGDIHNTSDANPAADNICQTQVIVTEPTGPYSSIGAGPLPTYFGVLPETNEDGLLEVPSGYEISPVPDEYDYVPAPTVSAVSTNTVDDRVNADPSSYGDATTVEIAGTGLNYQTLNWFSFGDPSEAADQDTTYPLYADGTTVYMSAPESPTVAGGGELGTATEPAPVVADTMGGQSADDTNCAGSDCVTYAGIPDITSVTSASNTDGIGTSPDTGGTAVTIRGDGLTDVIRPLEFADVYEDGTEPPFSIGTQYSLDHVSDSEITTETVSQNPAFVDTYVCSDSGCYPDTATQAEAEDELLLYPPGDPVITSVQDASGPAFGGTLVTINGENLSCVTSVSFGSTVAESFTNAQALLDCGSSTQLTVVAPPGELGQSVPITVTTVETDATGANAATSPTDFTYDAANPSVTGSVAFGSVDLGSSSNTATVTISNPASATQPLDPEPDGAPDANGNQTPVYASIIGAGKRDFTIATDGCTDVTLTPGESCSIQVEFTPSELGSRDAVLDIPWDNSTSVAATYDDDSLTGDFTTALSGTGSEPTVTNTVTTPGTSTTVTTTVTKTVACTITVTSKWVTVKVHGKKRREFKKVTTRSKGCPKTAKKAAKPKKKHSKPSKKPSKKHKAAKARAGEIAPAGRRTAEGGSGRAPALWLDVPDRRAL